MVGVIGILFTLFITIGLPLLLIPVFVEKDNPST